MRPESAWIALGNSRASLSRPTLKPQWLFLAPGQAQASRLCKIILDLINHTASIISSKNKAELVFSLSSECTSLMPTSLTLSVLLPLPPPHSPKLGHLLLPTCSRSYHSSWLPQALIFCDVFQNDCNLGWLLPFQTTRHLFSALLVWVLNHTCKFTRQAFIKQLLCTRHFSITYKWNGEQDR